ncbi:hypothetical protein KPL78_29460 [Roseomonas sp. HJA6]|uniref:Uncharacterized protein n=1 Tax=Roseomonas alba TaxID=2846776 RepID=A0ABS7AI67_9PROT|nr:hypothetical protein [Neoroseomonas alba]MBW6402010.1 hypothetical protein [Neoroseomonas alba]
MNEALSRARLYLIAGAALVFVGGLLVAVGHWNRAETDRAFVAAAAEAMRAPPPSNGVRYWAPSAVAAPDSASRVRLEAMERLRQVPTVLPTLPRTAPSPGEKTPVTPR